MRNKHLRWLIVFGAFVLTGLFIVQIYWFRKAFDVESRQFDHTVQIALMRVADSVSRHAEIKKLSSNFYFVSTESQLNGESLDTLIRTEFGKRNLSLNYELGVYDAEDDTLVYGQYVEATKQQRSEKSPGDSLAASTDKNFALYFPTKESYIIARMDVWIFSTMALIMMMCFFAWAIATLLRERKFAEIKTDFVNNMTHEFKTPVTNIGISGEMIRKKIGDTHGAQVYIDILLKENEKLRSKIEYVLSAASVETRRKPSLQPLDIHNIISACAETFQMKLDDRKGRLQLQLNAENAFILGDRELLTQAIINVIDNAEKFSPHTPHIIVRTSNRKGQIEIDICDNGIGIPEKLHRKVFEKFFRIQSGDVHNVKGFGLGLNFVKSVVDSHRGQVNLSSALNKGTEVRILLPAT